MSDKRRLLKAFDLLQDLAPGSTLRVKSPPASSRTPWLLAGWFGFPGDTTYDDIGEVLTAWDGRATRAAVGKQRLSRIQVRYTTSRGRRGEYTLAETGAWTSTVARARERVLVRDATQHEDRESLVERYGVHGDRSQIDALVVWFSELEWSPRWKRVTGLPEVKAKRKAKAKRK